MYRWYIDWRIVYDGIGIGGGWGIYIGDKEASYAVVAKVIFVYREGADGVSIGYYLYDVMFVGFVLIKYRKGRLCR